MFIETSSKIDTDELSMIKSQAYDLAGKVEVVEVIGINIWHGIRLECSAIWWHGEERI